MTSRQGAARRLGMAVSDPLPLAIRGRAEPARRRGASRPRSPVCSDGFWWTGPTPRLSRSVRRWRRAACPRGAGRLQGLLAVLAGDLEEPPRCCPVRQGSSGRGTIIQCTSCFRCSRGRSGASPPGSLREAIAGSLHRAAGTVLEVATADGLEEPRLDTPAVVTVLRAAGVPGDVRPRFGRPFGRRARTDAALPGVPRRARRQPCGREGMIPWPAHRDRSTCAPAKTTCFAFPGRATSSRGVATLQRTLKDALVAEVNSLASRPPPPTPIAEVDLTDRTRRKVEPMVRGLFPRGEREAVLGVLARSVPATVGDVVRQARWLGTAWRLANLYLRSIGARPVGPDAPDLVGISEETTCWVSSEYFRANGRFEDFVVHEAPHVFHNCKRRTAGLPETRRREWLPDIAFGKRETFADASEAYARIVELGETRAARLALVEELAARVAPVGRARRR